VVRKLPGFGAKLPWRAWFRESAGGRNKFELKD
jgi:hypothetical protein